MVSAVTATSRKPEGSGMPPCLLKLRASLQSLPVHHARIAHFAMLNPADFLQLDARQIGYQCGTSEATVVRFCQRAGYKGLSEMKKILSLELATALMPSQSVIKADIKESIPQRVFSDCIVALKDTSSFVDQMTMERIAIGIARSESIYLFGAGGSAHIAQEAALKFLLLGFRTIAFVDLIQQIAAARILTSRDVAIAVTYSGNQPEVAQALQIAKERQAFCVCITSFEQSLVSKSADALLLISTPSETLRGQTGAHRVAQIAILDALAVWAGELRAALTPTKGRKPAGKKASRALRPV
ncbi:MAG: MurR/RpiR family transcriptional regulator [Candidatus Binatia bacterium]